MQDWEKTVSTEEVISKDDNKKHYGNELFYRDGFLPGYYGTDPKVLFIGKESRYTGGLDYIETTIDTFRKQNINQRSLIFYQRILCMYNVIRNNGIIDENITADQIAKSMVDKKEYGFAIMNISKYSNDSDTGTRRSKYLMNKFFEDSKLDKTNYIKKELEILDPDLIITAYLWDGTINEEYLDKHFGKTTSLGKNAMVNSVCAATLNSIELNNKSIKLIDTYHFSWWKVNSTDYYYNPIKELLFDKS